MSPQDRAQITFRSETHYKELQDVPKMICSSAFLFGVLEALPLNIFFNIFSIITLNDKI